MHGKKVLIVEDERHIVRFLEFVLTRKGYDVVFANEGAQALEMLESISPDIMLLDLALPDMSGLEVLKRLRATERHAGIKVLVLTGQVFESTSGEVIKAGANAQCAKPIAPSTLLRTLELLDAPNASPSLPATV